MVIEGDKLEYQPAHVQVDEKALVEPYTMEPPNYSMPPKKLGPDDYFMMGDNRNNSNDSHVWGALKRDRFVGKAEYRFWPIERAGTL